MPARSQLARVHLAKRELHLSDALHRDFHKLWFGKSPSRNISPDEVENLRVRFKGLGWGQERLQPIKPGAQNQNLKPVRERFKC